MRTGYPIRVAKDAVADANELLTARHALLIEYHELWKERYENTKIKYETFKHTLNINPNFLRMIGLKHKMERQLKHIKCYEQHILHNTSLLLYLKDAKILENCKKEIFPKKSGMNYAMVA